MVRTCQQKVRKWKGWKCEADRQTYRETDRQREKEKDKNHLPVAVVVEPIVAGHSDETTPGRPQGVEDLDRRIPPYLEQLQGFHTQ